MSDLIKREDVLECIDDAQDGNKKTYDILADVFNRVLALPSEDAVEVVRCNVDHDRDWIIGCIQHDGFIHTHRFDKANQIILDALSAESEGDLISRQWLLDLYATPEDGDDVEWKVPLKVVRQNILDAPSAEAVPHGRLIDADSLISDLEEWKENPNNDDSAVDLVNHFIGIIRATPSAEAVQGKWIRKEKELTDGDSYCVYYWYECDRCGAKPPKDQWGHEWHSDFCPNCGAKMIKGGDTE